MNTINFKIDYNSVKMTNPEMGSEVLARKSRYILENKLVFNDPVILRVGLYARLSVEDGDDEISDSIATQLAIGAGFFALNPELILFCTNTLKQLTFGRFRCITKYRVSGG